MPAGTHQGRPPPESSLFSTARVRVCAAPASGLGDGDAAAAAWCRFLFFADGLGEVDGPGVGDAVAVGVGDDAASVRFLSPLRSFEVARLGAAVGVGVGTTAGVARGRLFPLVCCQAKATVWPSFTGCDPAPRLAYFQPPLAVLRNSAQ